MLTIRPDQVDLFRREAQTRLESQLVAHFQALYPRECREAGGPPAVLKLVRLGIAKASEHGYVTQQQAGFTIGLMILLGVDFDVDPQIPWAGKEFDDSGIADPNRRIQGLYHHAVEYLSRTAGEKLQNLVKAMIRLKAADLKEFPLPSSPTWEADLRALLGRWYPEKSGDQGEGPTTALIRSSAEAAKRYGLTGNAGRGLVATLMFMLGSGFDHDPLYPWAARTLTIPGYPNEAARVVGLHRDAISHLQLSLAPK
jgi:hypothetical protein